MSRGDLPELGAPVSGMVIETSGFLARARVTSAAIASPSWARAGSSPAAVKGRTRIEVLSAASARAAGLAAAVGLPALLVSAGRAAGGAVDAAAPGAGALG